MDQGLINTVITLGAGIFGWIMKTLWDSVRRLEKEVSDIEVLVAREYVKRDEFRQDIQRIFEKLDTIEAKIDSKADKQ
jgi:hypothetical protein|tara:strand:+ start:166 stop:399 length:234 start_codon:yes stop_codon:yes gene_type:complete